MITEFILDATFEHIDRLVQLLGYDEEDAVFAAQELILYGEAAVQALKRALFDGEVEIRRKAVWPLWMIHSTRALDALVDALEHDPDAKVRRYAAYALGELQSDQAVIALVRAFGDEDERVRWDAAVALAKIGAPAIEHLVFALQYAGEQVRLGAVTALGWMREDSVIGWLSDALTDPDEVVRTRAAFALGWLCDPRAVEPLIAALSDRSDEVRMQAALGLGWLRDRRAIEPLVTLLGEDIEGEWLPRAVTDALYQIGGSEAVKALTFVARYSFNWDVRRAARSTLTRMGLDPDQMTLDLVASASETRLWREPNRRCNLVITPKV